MAMEFSLGLAADADYQTVLRTVLDLGEGSIEVDEQQQSIINNVDITLLPENPTSPMVLGFWVEDKGLLPNFCVIFRVLQHISPDDTLAKDTILEVLLRLLTRTTWDLVFFGAGEEIFIRRKSNEIFMEDPKQVFWTPKRLAHLKAHVNLPDKDSDL